MTACSDVRIHYAFEHPRYLHITLIIAVFLHVLVFVFWPEYVPAVYKARAADVIHLEKYAPIDVPPPPKEAQLPRINSPFEASDEASDDVTIEPTIIPSRLLRGPRLPVYHETIEFIPFDTMPRVIHRAVPEYPELAQKAEVEGKVSVLVTIDTMGNVIDASINHSENPILNRAAIDAAYRFKFSPAMQRDIPVMARIELSFTFMLRD